MVPSATREGPKRISSRVPTVSNSTRSPRGSDLWCASAPQWKPWPGRVGGAGERRADHHRVGAAGDRLGDVAGLADRAVRDDVHVAAAGLVEVVAAGGGDVGDRGGHRDGDAEDGAGGVRGTAAEADQHAGRAGAHQVQRGLVGGAAADDDRDVELVDELLEVERLGLRGDVLGADRRAADHEHVDARVDDGLGELAGALRRQRAGDGDARVADLAEPLGDQLLLDRLGVHLLEPGGGLLAAQPGDLGQQRRSGPRSGSRAPRG